MRTLTSTNVHYIRCVRPNALGVPGDFDRNQVDIYILLSYVERTGGAAVFDSNNVL